MINLLILVGHSLFLPLKYLPGMRETQVQLLGREDPLEKEMATHSSRKSHGQKRLVSYNPWGHKGVRT